VYHLVATIPRKWRAGVLAFALFACSGMPSLSQTIIYGNEVDGFLLTARRFGQATLTEQPDGNPMLVGKINGVPYSARFRNCVEATCADLNFRVGFLSKPTLETLNGWNRDKRFSRAYLDADGDAILEMDLIVQGGLTAKNLLEVFTYWRLTLDQFTAYIGFK